MTTNETPYRPQIGDIVIITKPLIVSSSSGDYISAEVNSTPTILHHNSVQLISRADGVPVEKAVDLQKVNDELRKELAEALEMLAQARPDVALMSIRASSKVLLGKIDAFVARHQPPSSVDTQRVKP